MTSARKTGGQVIREEAAQRRRYADAGPEMERLLMIARAEFAFDVGEQIDAVLKAVQPKKEKR